MIINVKRIGRVVMQHFRWSAFRARETTRCTLGAHEVGEKTHTYTYIHACPSASDLWSEDIPQPSHRPLILSRVICFVISPYFIAAGAPRVSRLRAWLNFMQFRWYRFHAAAQIYLKFGTEPALSAAKPHCGRTAQAAGMTTFRRRHILRSGSINKEWHETFSSVFKNIGDIWLVKTKGCAFDLVSLSLFLPSVLFAGKKCEFFYAVPHNWINRNYPKLRGRVFFVLNSAVAARASASSQEVSLHT